MSARTASLRLASDPAIADLVAMGKLRPSIPIEAAAAAISVDESWARKLLAAGELEGHKVGTRAIRVYVDSIEAYQKGHPLGGRRRESAPRSRPEPRRLEHAGHREAVAALMEAGALAQDAPLLRRRGRG